MYGACMQLFEKCMDMVVKIHVLLIENVLNHLEASTEVLKKLSKKLI